MSKRDVGIGQPHSDPKPNPPPKVGKGKRNPTRWLVGSQVNTEEWLYEEIRAVGARAAVEILLRDHDTAPGTLSVRVWPLRPGDGPLEFTTKVESVTKTTITEA